MASSSNIPKYLYVLFFPSVLIFFSWFGRFILSFMCSFLLVIISISHFSLPNSITMSWLYILRVCILVSNYRSVFANILMSSIYMRWLIFSCNLVSLYLLVYFPNMWLNGIITITNINGDGVSPWKIILWILTSAKLFSPADHLTVPVSMVFLMNFMTVLDILNIFWLRIIHFRGSML